MTEQPSDARITALEAKVNAHQGSLTRRLSMLAGVAAFIISMFAIFDRVVTKPNEEKVAEYDQLKSDIRSIATADADLAEKSSGGNAAVANALSPITGTITQSYLGDAGRMLALIGADTNNPHSRFFIGSYEFMILSMTAYNGGNVPMTLNYADRAVAAAENPFEKSEALRVKAWRLFSVKGADAVGEVRAAIKQALEGLAGENTQGTPTERAQLWSTQTAIEAASGYCADAAASAAKTVEAASAPDVSRALVLGPLEASLKGQTRCPLSGFPEDVRAAFTGGGETAQASAPIAPVAPGPAGAGLSAEGAATAAPETGEIPAGYSLTCHLMMGPRAGQTQSYEGVAGVRPVPIGSTCGDGQGSFGRAQ